MSDKELEANVKGVKNNMCKVYQLIQFAVIFSLLRKRVTFKYVNLLNTNLFLTLVVLL